MTTASTEVTPASTTQSSATTTTVVPPPAAPALDVAKITKDATDAATKVAEGIAAKAEARLTAVARALSGESDKPEVDPLLERLIKQPAETLRGIKELTKQELRAEDKSARDFEALTQSIAQPLINEYPQLNTPAKLAMADKLTEQYQAQGKSYKEALELGLKDTIKEFGLTAVSTAQQQANVSQVGLPTISGIRTTSQPRVSEEQASADFIAGMRGKAQSFRRKA